MTLQEAMQRNNVNGVVMRRANPASTQWIVTLTEWTREQCHKFRYITDDIEDAVLSGSYLRSVANRKPMLFT